jgi:cytoskeletal protein CcmA (bactofilin family)
MAQIIKHRRGSISSLSSVTANVGELVMATGSIGDLTAPVIFIGDSAVAGGYKPVSKIYQGTAAPDLTSNNWGTTMNGTPFYASGNKSLNILNNAGNTKMDLTGNIEGNTIVGVTITSLSSTNITGSNGNFTNLTGLTFTSTNGNITSLTGSNANITTLTGLTFTSTNGNITSLSGSNANISNITGTTITGSNARITGDLSVEGAVYVTGDISGSDLNLTGNATIDGDIILKGNINIGNQTTDIIQFGGEVSSSIVPLVNNSFDLGSPTQGWRDLFVSGTANIGTLNLGSITLNSLSLPGDLTVSGTTALSGSVYNDNLTDNRVVIVGVNGLLEDDANFTFDGTTLNVGQGHFEVDYSDGDIRTSGSLTTDYIIGKTNGNNALHLNGGDLGAPHVELESSGQISLFSEGAGSNFAINMTGSVYMSDSLNVIGRATFLSGATVTGSLLTTNIKGTGSLYLQPDQSDSRYFEIYNTGVSDTHIKSNGGISFFGDDTNYLKIDDGAKTATIVGVNGVFISSSLTVTGTTTINGDETVNGNLTVTGTTNVTGNSAITGTLYVSDNFTANGSNSTLTANYGGNKIALNTYNGATIDLLGQTNINGNTNITGALVVSGSTTLKGTTTNQGDLNVTGILTVTGDTRLQSNLYVSGNLEVLGSSTNVNLQSSTVNINDNIILVNAYSPFEQYAGLAAYDSGSSGVSGSVLWDSLNDYWLIQKSDGNTSKVVGTTTGSMGSEISLTTNNFPKATSANTIGDSLLVDNGTTLSYNTNKFTVASNDGATLIAGNVTLSYSGGTDNANKTSTIVFKNSSNVLGYVSTTETTDVLDGILGYKNSNGGLVFSTVIDGGTY